MQASVRISSHNRCKPLPLWWIFRSTWIIWTKCCKAAKDLSLSITTPWVAFKLKLSLWKTQLSGDDTVHFLCLKSMRTTGLNTGLNQYKDKTELLGEFKQRFQIFDQLETDFQVFFSPFTLNASDLPVDLQLGIIDLQCDSNLKTKLVLTSLGTFYQYLFPGYQWRSQPKNWGWQNV